MVATAKIQCSPALSTGLLEESTLAMQIQEKTQRAIHTGKRSALSMVDFVN